jgi:hypothetical protein
VDCRDVLSSRDSVSLQASFPSLKKDVGCSAFVNASGQGHYQDGVGPLVTVPSIQGHYDHGPSSLSGWINGKLNEPDLAAEWRLLHEGQSVLAFGQLAEPKFAP